MLTCAFFSRHLGSKVMAGSLAHSDALAHKLHESDNDTDRHSLKELIHIHAISHTHAPTLPGVPLKQWPKHRCMQLRLRLSTRIYRSQHSHPTYAWSVLKDNSHPPAVFEMTNWRFFCFEYVLCFLAFLHAPSCTANPATGPHGTLRQHQKLRPSKTFLFVKPYIFLNVVF